MKQKNKGFTLVELLVVISIIGMLAAVGLVTLESARSKSRDVRRLADKKQVTTALNLFYNANGRWPTTDASGSNWSCLAPSSESCWQGNIQGSDSLVTDLQPYLPTMPTTLSSSGTYAYNRLVFITRHPFFSPVGAYLIWEQETNDPASICSYPAGNPPVQSDRYWYCYDYLGP